MVICRLFVGCFWFFVCRLRFFVCRLRFFVCGLGFLVCRLGFFVCRLRFLVCRFRFLVCRLRLFVTRFRFFVSGFRFFIGWLRFFVGWLGFFVGWLRFFVGWFRFLCRFNITNGGWFMNRVVVGSCRSMNTCGMGMIAASGHRICHSMVGCIGVGVDIAKGWWGMDRVVGSIDRSRSMIGFRFFVGRFGFFVGRFGFFVSRLRSFGGCYIAKGGRSVDRMMVGVGRSRCLVRSGLWFFIDRLWLLSSHFGLFWGFRLRLFRSSLRFFVGRLRFGRFCKSVVSGEICFHKWLD